MDKNMKIKIDMYDMGKVYTITHNRNKKGDIYDVPDDKVKEWNDISEKFENMQYEMANLKDE